MFQLLQLVLAHQGLDVKVTVFQLMALLAQLLFHLGGVAVFFQLGIALGQLHGHAVLFLIAVGDEKNIVVGHRQIGEQDAAADGQHVPGQPRHRVDEHKSQQHAEREVQGGEHLIGRQVQGGHNGKPDKQPEQQKQRRQQQGVGGHVPRGIDRPGHSGFLLVQRQTDHLEDLHKGGAETDVDELVKDAPPQQKMGGHQQRHHQPAEIVPVGQQQAPLFAQDLGQGIAQQISPSREQGEGGGSDPGPPPAAKVMDDVCHGGIDQDAVQLHQTVKIIKKLPHRPSVHWVL